MDYINIYNTPEINKKEILRYAGVFNADDQVDNLLEACINDTRDILTYKVCYDFFPVSVNGDEVDFGFKKICSHSLALCLKECDRAIIFCATVGVELDRMIKRQSILSPANAVMLQALGSERVEALCDEFCRDMAEETKRELRPRFSPGYGDLPLEFQRDIFGILEPAYIGVSLSENLFMTPSKSVTAIIGMKKEI